MVKIIELKTTQSSAIKILVDTLNSLLTDVNITFYPEQDDDKEYDSDESEYEDDSESSDNNGGNSAKKNKGMSYDIKEASNQKLSASARKHYAENAQAANKSGYKG